MPKANAPATSFARTPLRLLLVEDSEDDAELVVNELRRGGYEPTWKRVDTGAALAEALDRQSWDVILCDYVMPQCSAPEALKLLRERGCDLPVIIVSGQVGEEVAAETMRAGAHDYVNKSKLARLVPAIERELKDVEVRRARRLADAALRASEDRYRDLVEHSQDLICTHDLDGRILSINGGAAAALGYEVDEILNRSIRDVLAAEVRDQFADYMTAIRRDGCATGLMRVQTKTGRKRVWEYRNTLRTEGVTAPTVRGMAHDVTERLRAEAALRKEKLFSDTVIASVPGAFYVVDRHGRLIRWNKTLEDLFGLSAEQIRNMDVLTIVHTDDRALAARKMREVFEQGDAETEVRVIAKGGMVRHLMLTGKRMDADGVAYLVGTGVDVTERKQAEAVLRDSELRFRSLIENGLDVVAIVDRDGVLRYVSPSHEQASGYTPAELVGRNAFDFVHPDDVPQLRRRLAEGVQRGETAGIAEYRFRHKDGSWRHVEGIARNLMSDPVVRGILVNSRDVTARKQAEDALHASEERFRSVFCGAGVGMGIATLDDGRFVDTNPALQAMLGYSAAELSQMTWIDITHPDDVEDTWRLIREVAAGKRDGCQMEKRHVRKNGETIWSRLTISPLRDGAGHPLYVIGMVEGITDRKRAEQQVSELNAELEQRIRVRTTQLEAVNKELEAFSYSVSHDLRAPLRAIDGFSRLLLEQCVGQFDAQARSYLQNVRANADRMGELINDLLELSRVAQIAMHWEQVNLSALARGIAAELRTTQPDRQVQLIIADGVVVRGDAGLLRVLLQNLLSNAWKYTGKHATARIEFGVQHNGETVYFVRDDGAGFDMTYAAKLFGAFQRLHSEREFEGTGIGLATVERIIQRHGGRIWAEGAVEQGATFYFTL